jgi:hypothetical protein
MAQPRLHINLDRSFLSEGTLIIVPDNIGVNKDKPI